MCRALDTACEWCTQLLHRPAFCRNLNDRQRKRAHYWKGRESVLNNWKGRENVLNMPWKLFIENCNWKVLWTGRRNLQASSTSMQNALQKDTNIPQGRTMTPERARPLPNMLRRQPSWYGRSTELGFRSILNFRYGFCVDEKRRIWGWSHTWTLEPSVGIGRIHLGPPYQKVKYGPPLKINKN